MTITRINEFEAVPSKGAELFAFLSELKAHIDSSPGCLSCEVLRKNDNDLILVVIEKWETKDAHRQSIESYPQEKMAEVMPLFALPPKGGYYHS